ncbi:zinc finger protein 568-like isoform X1 [Dermacentor albipictus]|uniref:zinc finger protein 568-like isoform X1 n=1 Tax=Dermacentor albipictus TaxID=60249 RepID=UPI0038FCD3CB
MDKKRKGRPPKAIAAAKAKAVSTTPAKAATPVKRGRGRPPGSGKKKLATEGSAKKSSPVLPVAAATPQKNGTGGPECDRCLRTFSTERGLKVHQRWPCKLDAAKDDDDDASGGLPLDDVMDSDSDSDVPLGKVASGRGIQVKADLEDEVESSPDHPKGRLASRLASKLASGKKPQLICQRCGLSYDPKRDGPRCKHCTRDNEHSDESGDEDDKEGENEDSAQVNGGSPEKENEAEGGEDGPVKNIQAVTDVIKAAKAEQRLQQLKRRRRGSPPDDTIEKDLDCPVCGKQFTKKYYLQRHLQMTVCSGKPPPSHPCEVCGKVYSRKDNLREHLRAHAGEVTRRKKYKCDHCGKTFHGISLLKIHIRVHTGERPFPCDFCNKGFPSVTALNKHRRIHTGEKPYACAECGMRFSLKGTLNRHTRIHTGIRPHKCPYCGKEFIQGGGLKAHLFHHTGMNGFKCTVCDKVFNRKARLDLHMKYLHLKEKPHVCEDCGKGFTRREDLNRHSVLHTGEKPFQCPTCHKRFAIKPSLKIHMVTHTKEEPRSCHECGRAFIRKDCLMRHMRKRHRDLLDRILLDEEDDRFAPTPVATPGGTANTDSGIKLGPQAGTVARILSEQALCESIRELLGLLVDEPTLKGFGYPDKPVDELLEAVIRRCGHSPASPDDYNYMDRLRENSKLLFTVVIDDNAVKTLLNNQTVDEVILHVLRLAKS